MLNLYTSGKAWYSLDFLISEKEAGFSTSAPKMDTSADCMAGVSFVLYPANMFKRSETYPEVSKF